MLHYSAKCKPERLQPLFKQVFYAEIQSICNIVQSAHGYVTSTINNIVYGLSGHT